MVPIYGKLCRERILSEYSVLNEHFPNARKVSIAGKCGQYR